MTVFEIPITPIDAKTNKVTHQYAGSGGDAILYAHGSVWLRNLRGWRSVNPKLGLRSGQYACQKPQFRLHIVGISHCVRDFLADEVAVALAQPMNRDFNGSLGDIHFARQYGIRSIGPPEQEDFQVVEMFRAAVTNEFSPQLFHDLVEYRKRPATLENSFGRLPMCRLALVALFA